MTYSDECLKFFLERKNPEKITANLLYNQAGLYPQRWGGDVPPENVIVEVLKNEKTPRELYNKIIKSCKKIGEESVSNPEDESQEKTKKTLERLCRVISLSAPEELEELTRSTLLPFALKKRNEDFWRMVSYGIFCSSSRYSREEDEKMYEELLHEKKFAALAFNKLIELYPNNPNLKEYLRDLWLKKFNEGWITDVAFLTLGYLEMTNTPYEHLRDLFVSIKKQDSEMYDKLLKELDELKDKKLLSIAKEIN